MATTVAKHTEEHVPEQHMIIIRHGERLDNVDGMWTYRSPRPYDPPLTEDGVKQAASVARELIDKNIQVVVCSPFLRCLQTCREMLKVLDEPGPSPNPAFSGMHLSNGVVDIISRACGIRQQPEVPAPDIESHSINVLSQDSQPLPTYPERTRDGLKRYDREFKRIADNHYPKNVLIVTHGFGVSHAITMTQGPTYRQGSMWVDYCGYVEISRVGRSEHEWTLMRMSEDVHDSGAFK